MTISPHPSSPAHYLPSIQYTWNLSRVHRLILRLRRIGPQKLPTQPIVTDTFGTVLKCAHASLRVVMEGWMGTAWAGLAWPGM